MFAILQMIKVLVVSLLGELPDWSNAASVKEWIVRIADQVEKVLTWIMPVLDRLTTAGIRLSVEHLPCAEESTSKAILACATAGDDLTREGKLTPEQWGRIFKFLQTALPIVLQLFIK